MIYSALLVLALLATSAAAQSFPGQQFLVSSLPGLAQMPAAFDTYSGYITVDQAAGRALFFMFTEAAEVNPANAPLVVWFTGEHNKPFDSFLIFLIFFGLVSDGSCLD